MMTIKAGKTPEVHRRKIKLKTSEGHYNKHHNHSQEKQTEKLANSNTHLGVSASVKVIENRSNSYMEKDSSKKSIQLSDSCPKENLVRQLYQRPGILQSYEGLNSRLRSMSVKRSIDQESDSVGNIYPAKPEQLYTSNGQIKVVSKQSSLNTIVNELQE